MVSDLDEITERVENMLAVVRDTPPGERRRKLVAALLKRGSALDQSSKEFATLLERRSDWLLDHPNHPEHDKREAALIRDINRYIEAFDTSELVLSANE